MIVIITLNTILIFIILAWVFIYTTSYSVWTFKRKNKIGAIMVFIIALIALLLPIFTIYYTR